MLTLDDRALHPTMVFARRRASPAGRAGKRPTPGSGKWGWGPRTWAIVVLLVVGAATALWLGRRSKPPAPAPHPAATMGTRQAYARGAQLASENRFSDALPYLQSVLNNTDWHTHHDYAATLINWAEAGRLRHGVPMSEARSSWERVARVQEGLQELEQAQALTRTPRDRADVLGYRAQVLATWGLEWDAVIDYHRMVNADSTWLDAAGKQQRHLKRMRDPERD